MKRAIFKLDAAGTRLFYQFLFQVVLTVDLWVEQSAVDHDSNFVCVALLDAPIEIAPHESHCLLCLHVAIVVESVHVGAGLYEDADLGRFGEETEFGGLDVYKPILYL